MARTGEEALEAYRYEKLRLAEVLVTLMHIARSRRDDERADQIRELAGHLAEDRFQLAVMGQFSRGKSTLMNALLGHDYLPTGALPMTSVVTTVVYGSRTSVTIGRGEGRIPIEARLEDLARYVAQSSPERKELAVTSALIELPAELLRLGFSFVDTPGVGSALTANTQATLAFLPQADAVIFVTSFDSPFSEAEQTFLRSVRGQVKRIFVVLNKRDLVRDAEATEVETFVLERLKEPGFEHPEVFALSARDGLSAKLEGDTDGLLASGVTAFESELTRYLTTEKAGEFLLRTADRAERFIASFASEAQAAAKLPRDAGQAARPMQFVDAPAKDLDAERANLLEALAGSASRQLERLSKELAPRWPEALVAALGPDLGPFVPPRRRSDLVAHLQACETQTRERAKDWGNRAVREWFADLEKEGEATLAGLTRLPEELVSKTADHFGTVAAPGWSAPGDRVPHMMPVPVDWSLAVPRKLAARLPMRGAAPVTDSLRSAAESYVCRLVDSARASVGYWLTALATRSEAELCGAARQVQTRLATPADDHLESELSALRAVLAASRSRVEPGPTRPRSEVLRTHARSPNGDAAKRELGCAVCARLVRVLFEFMSHYQFELATRVGQRASHLAEGGFCGAHTWYYEQIGSPVGISEAYAPLAEAAANVLVGAAADRGDLAALQGALSQVTRTECRACTRLNAARLETLERLRRVLGQPGTAPQMPPICLRHATELVNLGLDEDLARQVVLATANRVRRRSEDMRTYSLKRQSLRPVSREEEAAYRDALLLLVGHPLLLGVVRGEDA
ncbi:MAG TPA: dynamin family protein [Acidimicrobiales bacterium]|nr:dynamin family protein [Acidimicrobiales bacterium]